MEAMGVAPTYYAYLDPIVFEDNVLELQELIGGNLDTRFFTRQPGICWDKIIGASFTG